MIKEKELTVKVIKKTITHYLQLGIDCKIGDKLTLPIEKIYQNTDIPIIAICDNSLCERKEISTSFYNYNRDTKNGKKIYLCKKCRGLRFKLNAEEKYNNGTLKREDKNYWMFEENRLKEFNFYITKYQTIDNMKRIDHNLYNALFKYDGGLLEFLEKHNIIVDYNKSQFRFYNTKENVINAVNDFIIKNNRFPKAKDFNTEDLPFVIDHARKFWKSLNELKKEIGYNIKNDLIDNRGDYNRSLGELYMSNYLIAQGFKDYYKREQFPFDIKENKSRSDFTFYLENNMELHIEIWGYKKEDKSSRGKQYNLKRQNKERLYKKYENIILISIEFEDYYCSYDEMQNNFYNKLSSYLNLNLNKVDWIALKSYEDLTEEKLIEEIQKFEKKNQCSLGRSEGRRKIGGNFLYTQALKFGGLYVLRKKFNY